MQIITLNIWGGYLIKPLLNFFSAHQEIDVFCLQEAYHRATQKISTDNKILCLDILDRIQEKLPNHHAYFTPVVGDSYGLAIFYRKTLNLTEQNKLLIHNNPNYSGSGPEHSRYLQYITCQLGSEALTIINMHGLWNGKGKLDSIDRISQANAIHRFIKKLKTPAVIAGDFNLRPDTQSMEIISSNLTNLISQYQITDTRTCYYEKTERYADYVLLSPEIKIISFKKMTDLVSDHAPLLLELAPP